MKKTSIYLQPELDYALERFADARGISKAEAVRQALKSFIGAAPRPRITAIGVGEGPGDVSENMERYLLESDFGRD